MANIKSYKDGSRLILVVENCVGETAAKVNNFLLDILGTAEQAEVPGVVPMTMQEEYPVDMTEAAEIDPYEREPFEAPSPEDVVRSMPVSETLTLGEAIDNNESALVVRAIKLLQNADDGTKMTGTALCKQYIWKDCQHRDPEIACTEEIMEFFKAYRPLIGVGIKQILESSGISSLEDFFALSDEYFHRAAYKSVLDDLIHRTTN